MAVKPEQLDHPERGLDLTTRDPRGATKVATDIERVKHGTPDAEGELQTLRARIEPARTLQPSPEQRHCLDCFEKGRDAALRLIEGTDRP